MSSDGDSRYAPFAHLAARRAGMYRAILRTFSAAKREFVVHLRAEDVRDRLPDDVERPDDEDGLRQALQQLVEWGNLRADQDTARVTTVEDFHRARFLYQLTHAGESAEHALEAFDDRLGRRGALQAVALADVETQLRALLRLCGQDDPDPGEVSATLGYLVARSRELADNAQAFMGSLQNTIDLHGVEVDAFIAYRDQLIEYLQRFLRDLVTVGGAIAVLLPQLDEAGVGRLLRLAAARDAADQTPIGLPDGVDPREVALRSATEVWEARWRGLHRWFLDTPEHPGQARLLRQRARSAIPQLLAVIARLNERREGRSDRAADFTALARWFAEAPDDRARHRLWRVAFGLHPARHLTVDPDTLRSREDRPVAPGTAWADAPALRISPRLRRTGSYERRGRPNRVVDRGDARRLLAERAAAEAAQTDAARARLLTDGPVRLADLGEIDAEAFPLFLGLLGDALSARRPGRDVVDVTTADGALRIRLRPTGDGKLATIRTATGTLRGPDHHLRIERVG